MHLTGGETTDVGYLVRTIIVDSTITARMKRDHITATHIQAGDMIVGLSSFGKVTNEDEYNGGKGSNCLTSVRHDVFAKYLAANYQGSSDPQVSDELVYLGKTKLTIKTQNEVFKY